ncbi:MAG: FG-GAP-like repeat-containing protein [Planctomycetota bacterium]
MDGDGHIDIVGANVGNDTIHWYQNDGNEVFTQRVFASGVDGFRGVELADLDGDGDLDVLSASINADTFMWHEYRKATDDVVNHVIDASADEAYNIRNVDIDGDGDLDVLGASASDDTIAWYENDGSQGFTKRVISNSVDGARDVIAADLDADGFMDVITASSFDHTIAWYKNDGSQNFTQQTLVSGGFNPSSVEAGDLDGDGDLDIAAVSVSNDRVAWLENLGDGTFASLSIISSEADVARRVHLADLDSDGDLDILSASSGDNKIAWYENISLDFGDAPGPYPTIESQDAARHLAIGPQLGADRSIESDGQPSSAADQDDFDDGIVLPSFFVPGETQLIDVDVTASGLLSGWIDFNANGNWDDVGEQIFADVPVTAGDQSLAFQVPSSVASGLSYARFRISTQAGLGVTGFANDGEVEDYTLTLPSAPIRISLSPSTVLENEPAGTLVGTLATIDADITDSHVYQLVTGDGDEDNASFTISGDQLVTAESFDFESKSSYSIRVRTTDPSSLSHEQTIALNVIDLDEIAPEIAEISPALESGVVPTGTKQIHITFSEQVDGSGDRENFELRNQGADGILGNSDDEIVSLSAYANEDQATLVFPGLSEGVYRLQISDEIKDRAGNSIAASGFGATSWTRDFVVNSARDSIQALSTTHPDITGNGSSGNPAGSRRAISDDGRFVVFSSLANNLIVDDTNQASDIFVHDRQLNLTTRVSTDSLDAQSNGDSFDPAISGDGKFVVFRSRARNLNPVSNSGYSNIFLKNLETGQLVLVSAGYDGTQAYANSSSPVISSDGRYIAFESDASNLVPEDTNRTRDVFVSDMIDGTTKRVSVNANGVEGDGLSLDPSISNDGRRIAFQSYARNLVDDDFWGNADIFVKDMDTGAISRVSTNSDGEEANYHSVSPAISGDGNFVVFESYASNLVSTDTNGRSDIFRKSIVDGILERVSTDYIGTQSNGDSFDPTISDDGRYVGFYSAGSILIGDDTNSRYDVFVKDTLLGDIRRASIDVDGEEVRTHSQFPSLSHDAQYILFSNSSGALVPGVTNSASNIFISRLLDPEGNLSFQSIEAVSTASPDTTADQYSELRSVLTDSGQSISEDGRYTVFTSSASNLVLGDTGYSDVFVFDRLLDQTTRVSTSNDGGQANSHSSEAVISSDGRYVAFQSFASNFVDGDTNGRSDIYVKDLHTDTISRVSTDDAGLQGNAGSYRPSISGDGRFIAFHSDANNLVPLDRNGSSDVFVADRELGTTRRLSTDSNGDEAFGFSTQAAISGDGNYIAFTSNANNLTDDFPDSVQDVFVKSLVNGSIIKVSVDFNDFPADNNSWSPSLSADGRFLVFYSYANDLIRGDTNSGTDVFLKDLQTDTIRIVSNDSDGIQGDGNSYSPSISNDGRYVSFVSESTNLTPGDVNLRSDVFVKDITDEQLLLVSYSDANGLSNSNSYASAISGDGRFVAFQSDASNLAAGDNNSTRDIWLARLEEETQLVRVSNEFVFDVDLHGHGAGQLLHGTTNAYDGLNRLIVEETQFSVSTGDYWLDDDEQTIVLGSLITDGIEVHREVSIQDSAGPALARTLDAFSNTLEMQTTISVRVVGNLGSDEETVVFSTSDGDTTVEPTDQWIGTDDQDGVDSPAIVHLLRSDGGIQPTSIDVIGDNVVWDYSLTIPAGETVRLAHFTVVADTRAEAIADAESLLDTNGLSEVATAFLSDEELSSLANFRFANDFGDAPAPYPSTLADDGARHTPTGPRLGATRDDELDGVPSEAADGDGDDEDGVMFGAVAVDATMAAVNIEMQDADLAFIDAWIDFNQDGDWDDEGEKILDDRIVFEGLQTLNFEVGDGAISGATFARVRISSEGGLDATGAADDGEVEDYQITITPPAAVVGRHVFYNRSFFDGSSFSVPDGNNDSAAIDPTKSALLPGEVATAANYTNYARGINGIFIDVENLPGDVTSEDFEFHTGNDNTPANWDRLTAPVSVEVFRGAGLDGSDRIRVTWEDNVIQRQWLQVTLKANVNTGLNSPDTHYWGNAIGDTYDSLFHTQSNATDQIRIRSNPRNFLNAAAVDDIFDINKDRFVNATDEILARNNGTNFLTDLNLISPPA